MWFFHSQEFRRRHRWVRIILFVGAFAVELPGEPIHMATTLKVGQTLPLSIAYLDQHGQPMASAPRPDVPPGWSQTTPATDTLTAGPDGATASAAALAAGTDTLKLDVMVGGLAFSATLDLTVEAVVPTQTLTAVEIVARTPI